jgi:hypothetical protein
MLGLGCGFGLLTTSDSRRTETLAWVHTLRGELNRNSRCDERRIKMDERALLETRRREGAGKVRRHRHRLQVRTYVSRSTINFNVVGRHVMCPVRPRTQGSPTGSHLAASKGVRHRPAVAPARSRERKEPRALPPPTHGVGLKRVGRRCRAIAHASLTAGNEGYFYWHCVWQVRARDEAEMRVDVQTTWQRLRCPSQEECAQASYYIHRHVQVQGHVMAAHSASRTGYRPWHLYRSSPRRKSWRTILRSRRSAALDGWSARRRVPNRPTARRD